MENKKNDSLKSNKKLIKNKYVEPIITIGLSILFAFVVLISIQSMMGTKTVTITNNKAEEYYYDGKYDEAINEYMTMQKEDAWPIWTARVAEIYSIQGDITQANNLLKEAIVKRDKLMLENGDEYLEQDKELINEVVFTFYMNNDLEQAESLGEYYLESYNTYKPLLKTMFAVYLANDEKDLAKGIVNSYPVDKDSAYDLATLAKMQIMINDYDNGLENLRLSYEIDKNEIKSYDVIMEACQFDKEKLLKKVTELSEENPKVEAYKAWINEINSFDEKNIDFSKNVIDEIKNNINTDELEEDSYVDLYIKAWENYNKGQYDKAKEFANEAILANSDYENTYGMLMPNILIATENSDKIEGYIRKAIFNEPYNYNLIVNIAKLYEDKLSNLDKAKYYYDYALTLNKNNDELYYDLALLNLKMDKVDDAILDLNKAIAIDEDKSDYYRALGTIYYNEKEYDKAIENIRKAYSLNEKDVLALNNAACYYITVDKDVWRAYSNIESAYNDMPSSIDSESKKLITNNYNAIKKVYDKYVNDENTIVDVQGLELAY
ncbi:MULTISPECIES: tetratricopeptide repeat protein [Clostridium]|mgnify:FL=1|uniref:tetratricopeptide repeat protein n=1 Tax=Clostridium TaxID=1485 RepID=UPI0004B67F91|nr:MULTISPECIES: tetratricopeptide repeat protein [Clostridium]MDU7455501.1 tetratricopeptide repeat protein [Clostridium saudiense]CUN67410.1 tetratricopeptide TPR_2 repeat-containing protein [Clostridium disporicum]SCJ63758.1 Predicted O-linked N-acetylglucosamine transferase%2C SPINDLY family [uncultured Clostridium sp.]